MKKQNWLVLPLAILLVFGLVFLGCDNSTTTTPGGSNPNDPVGPTGPTGLADDDSVWYHVYANDTTEPFTLEMGDNFLYGEGYQGQVRDARLFDGEQVRHGATYWLKATFTADRDFEAPLWAGLVDTVTGYWHPLTWDGDDEDDEGTLIVDTDDDGVYDEASLAADYVIKKGVEISGLFKFVAFDGAPTNALAENVLNFQTEGAGDPGTGGSGEEGPVTLTFTEFIFAKDTAYDAEKAGEAEVSLPPEPVLVDITVNEVPQTVTVIGFGTADPAEIENGYEFYLDNYGWDSYAYFQVDLGSGKLADYESIIFDIELGAGDAGHKGVFLWASNGTSLSGGGGGADQAVAGPNIGGAAAGNNYTGSPIKGLTLAIDHTKASALTNDVSKPYLSIYVSSGGVDVEIANIELVLRTSCACDGVEDACFFCTSCDCDVCDSLRAATATSVLPVTFTDEDDITVEGPYGDGADDAEPFVIVSSDLGNGGNEHGYTFDQGGPGDGANVYPNSYAVFQITLPAGIYLADYESVSLTYGAISGDAAWKTLDFGVSASDLTGYGAIASAEFTASASVDANLNAWVTATIPIDRTVAIALDNETTLYVGIGVSTKEDASYSISNIVFNPIEAE